MLHDSPHVRHEQRAALPCLGQQPEFEVIRAILPEIVYICDMDNSAHLQTVRRQPAVAGVPGPHVRIDECHTPNPINERATGELGETPGCPCNFGAPNAPPPGGGTARKGRLSCVYEMWQHRRDRQPGFRVPKAVRFGARHEELAGIVVLLVRDLHSGRLRVEHGRLFHADGC